MAEKPFFRKFDGWWYVQLREGGRRFQKKLVKGKENRQEAHELFNQLMADKVEIPAPTRCKVHDILAAFLKHAAANIAVRTFEFYQSFLANFDDLCGSLKPHQVTPQIVEAWLNANKGWKGCRRGAIIALKRAFNWAFDNGKITKNPLKGVKKPPSRARERFLTQGAGVLPLDPDRVVALLGETGLVHVEDRLRIVPGVGQLAAPLRQDVGVLPTGLGDELLESADHPASDRLGDVLDTATFATQQQPLDEQAGVGLILGAAEQGDRAVQERVQLGLEW